MSPLHVSTAFVELVRATASILEQADQAASTNIIVALFSKLGGLDQLVGRSKFGVTALLLNNAVYREMRGMPSEEFDKLAAQQAAQYFDFVFCFLLNRNISKKLEFLPVEDHLLLQELVLDYSILQFSDLPASKLKQILFVCLAPFDADELLKPFNNFRASNDLLLEKRAALLQKYLDAGLELNQKELDFLLEVFNTGAKIRTGGLLISLAKRDAKSIPDALVRASFENNEEGVCEQLMVLARKLSGQGDDASFAYYIRHIIENKQYKEVVSEEFLAAMRFQATKGNFALVVRSLQFAEFSISFLIAVAVFSAGEATDGSFIDFLVKRLSDATPDEHHSFFKLFKEFDGGVLPHLRRLPEIYCFYLRDGHPRIELIEVVGIRI